MILNSSKKLKTIKNLIWAGAVLAAALISHWLGLHEDLMLFLSMLTSLITICASRLFQSFFIKESL